MSPPAKQDQIAMSQLERADSHFHALAEKIHDGDDALKILHTHYEPYTREEETAVKRKIDRRLIPIMLLIDGIQFVDKQTISQAATYGIAKQARLVGQEFSLLISLFYIAYLVAQYPANLLMQKFPRGKVITISFILWGSTLTASGAPTSFATLAVGRFFLGVFESCVNPGVILITSSWWKREEQAARIGLWYCANGLLGGPSGLIFWGIAPINARHMFPYQWMFIIFGLVTVVIGMGLWWLLPDSPLTAKFLTDRERIIAIERLKSNKTGVKNTQHKVGQIKELATDLKVWMLVAAIFFHNLTSSLQTTFTGLVIKGFGYTTYQAGLFLNSRWGEGKRILLIIFCYFPGIVASAMLRAIPLNAHTKSSHLGAVMIIPTVAPSAGIMYSLLASNIAGYTKKTVAGVAFFVSNAVSNIVSPQTFLADDALTYQTGIAVTLAAFCINVSLFVGLYFLYAAENKRRDGDPDGSSVPMTPRI